MREALGRHFDVVVVVWAIALALVWMVLVLTRADLSNLPADQSLLTLVW